MRRTGLRGWRWEDDANLDLFSFFQICEDLVYDIDTV